MHAKGSNAIVPSLKHRRFFILKAKIQGACMKKKRRFHRAAFFYSK